MIGKPAILRTALSFIISLFFITAQAQPLLPDMAGITDKGVNILTWTCQYSGIKSIAVQRSSDSLMNFSTVGYVRNLQKGVQVFADGHPKAGDNYYELLIVFSSDLSWTSNRIKLYVDSTVIKNRHVRLPSNDSLQKYLITTTRQDVKTDEATDKLKNSPQNDLLNSQQGSSNADSNTGGGISITGIQAPVGADAATYTPYGSVGPKKKRTVIAVGTKDPGVVTTLDPSAFKNIPNDPQKTVIVVGTQDAGVVTSFDSSLSKTLKTNDSLVKKQPRITISLLTDVTDLNPYNYIKSEYVFTDDMTGNINITLPDVIAHSYTMKVYNAKNNMIMDIPRLSASPIIMDKRNFHTSGLYKFILKKDNKEFETGFVSVSLE